MPELGLKLVLEQRKFSDGFAGHRRIRPGYVFPVVIDTLDRKIIVPRPLNADRRAGADADAAGARDADLQERHVDHAHADRIRWQVGDLPARIVRLDLRGRSVNDHHRRINLDRGRDSTQTHRNIDRGRLIELNRDPSQLEMRESRGARRDGVIPR